MEFGESYLNQHFEEAFQDGVKAKNRGNYPLAREKFSIALGFLEKLAAISSGETKEKHQARADKLRAIIESLRDESSLPRKPRQTGAPSNPAQENSSTEVDDLIPPAEDIAQFITLFDSNELEFGFEGVIGLDDAKESITEYVINPVKYKEAYSYNFLDNKAILLYGPPGTGKTTFAKATAKEAGLPFFLVNLAGLVNCYIGETGKNIDKIFDYLRDYVARNNCDALVFFDEFDEIAKSRDSGDKSSEAAVPALLRNLDGVKKSKGLMILANTNYLDMLDEAVRSRFRRRIMISLPDAPSREKLFRLCMKEVEPGYLEKIDFAKAASITDGYSGRDIAYCCDDFKRVLAKIKAGLIEVEDLNLQLQKIIEKRKQ